MTQFTLPVHGLANWDVALNNSLQNLNDRVTVTEGLFVTGTIQGTQGTTGIQGAIGTQGFVGLQGTQGVQGTTGLGVQGTQGSLGITGSQGIQGPQGLQGPQGIQGITGSQGTQGIQGVQGGIGLTGIQGTEGLQGSVGAQGFLGIQGVTGSQGTYGAQGTQGIIGPTPSVTVITPITNTGTLTDPVIGVNATSADTPSYVVQRDTEGKFSSSAVVFDTIALPTMSTGVTAWDPTRETLKTQLNAAGVTLQHGQELHFYVRNTSGATIPNGTVVMVTGVNSDRVTVAPAINDGTVDPKYFLGVATQDIANNSNGFVTWFGEIGNLNTSAWTTGTQLYISSTGTLTSTQPAVPRHRKPIGYVTRVSPSVGIVLIRFSNGDTLGQTESNVAFTTPAKGDIIAYDSNSWGNVPVGTNGQTILADSTQPLGVKWGAPTPAAHAASHGYGASDAVTISSAQVTSGYSTVTAATYSVMATDVWITANYAGTSTITLPTATAGRSLTLRTVTANAVVSASANVVPLAGGAASTSILSATAGKYAKLVGDGTNWQVMEAN